ncbi:MAG: hypothetical protein RIR00_2294, partial [Pseudomonadota bacterium]
MSGQLALAGCGLGPFGFFPGEAGQPLPIHQL